MISVILMMAGNASRMNINTNKVYLPLADKLVFEYSLNLFLSYNFEIICVIRKEDRKYLEKYEDKVKIVYGGKTRQESVCNGLIEATNKYSLVHDAARPFINKTIIDKCINALKNDKAFMVVSPLKDSIYLKKPLKNINRDELISAQTPQGGLTKLLLDTHKKAIIDDFFVTDDISLVLKYSNQTVELIEGNDTNFKITTQLDYITAKEYIKNV